MTGALSFEHEGLPQRVVFAPHDVARATTREVRRFDAKRVMVIAGEPERELADRVVGQIPEVLRFDNVVMHVPIEVAKQARDAADSYQVDLIISVGGGSTTGLAKAVALTTRIPVIAIPTTYAGSEATNVWGLTEGARKTTGVDAAVLPRAIVYDASLTKSLPVHMSVASGLNALAHCVDSMWAPHADPINTIFATEGVRVIARALPAVVANPSDIKARGNALLGAYLSATSFTSAGSGLHHKICHVLGGTYDLPHAETHAVVLPHVLAFNGQVASRALARIASAFDAESAMKGIAELYDSIGAPQALADYGMSDDDIPEAARLVAEVVPQSNPRQASAKDLEDLLWAAQTGKRDAWRLDA